MKLGWTRRNLVLLAILAFSAFPSYYGSSFAAQEKQKLNKLPVAQKAVQVIGLRKIDQLKEAFQHDKGKVRLVTILSPT